MKRKLFSQSVVGLVIVAGALMSPSTMTALAPNGAAVDECAKELLLSYFPEPIVIETLKRFSIPQDKVAGITQSLSNKDKEIVKLVEDKASTMTPNPLKDPQQRQAAVKLFRETLLQVFTDALKENGITDTSKFQAMLDDIQQQKAKQFAMCMEKQKSLAQTKSSSNDNDDDDDDDDDENDDDEDQDEDDKSSKDLKTDQKTNAVPKVKQ